jgi:hypothetical protein
LGFATWLGAAAAADQPITGAFGLSFDEPVPLEVLGASIGDPPYSIPPGNLDQQVPPAAPGMPSDWFLFIPLARPELLTGDDVSFMVLRDSDDQPVRILAEHANPECIDDVLWLTRSLARKYDAPDDPFGAQRTGFRQSARFVHEQTQVDVSCGPRLLIEYTDGAGYRRWLKERAVRLAAHEAELEALAVEQARLEAQRRREFADLMTAGDRFMLHGALGIRFGEPVDPALFDSADFLPDAPLPATLPDLPEALADGSFTLTVGPDRIPVQVAGEFADADAQKFEVLAAALRAKYGPPMKDSARHKIHKVNGDYAVARHDPERGVARLVFIDDAGRAAQKAREDEAHRARLAEQRRQFEEETAGL